ncbi:MAG TPA: PAS domain S-box protein [Terriglobales bacterium]|nr:PAS domain S-box protein [Terriglobales bacterium]
MGQPFPILADAPRKFNAGLFEAAFRASSEGMAVAEGGVICYANQAFADMVGVLSPASLEGKQLSRFRPSRHPCEFSECESTAGESQHHLCQFVSRRRDGTSLNIESSCASFRIEGREFQLITVRDVTLRERRRMVRDGHQRFRVIFDAAPTGIFQCDLKGSVLESNPAVERMLGYTRTELRGMNLRDFIYPEGTDEEASRFGELVQGKRESYDSEARYTGRSSTSGWIRLTVSLVRGVDGRPQFAICMSEEITERKRSEQRLRDAQKMEVVGRLVGGVAHDFNNLLTGIMLYCDLLIAGLEKGSRLMHHAEEIRMAGEQGGALIQQLLAVSRKQVIEPRVLSLNEVILNTRNLLSRLLGEKYELSTRLKHDLGNVKMDPAQVQQILFNLVLNARDAMPQGGAIHVTTGHADLPAEERGLSGTAAVFLSVRDNGCGMSAETRSHLFEPFFTTKANGRGTGLGLATVYNIVKNSKGAVQVESEPDRGTNITVFLPRVTNSQVGTVESRFSVKPIGETVLLVEDNLAIREAAQKILSECGYVVLEAGSGPEAITVARAHAGKIDLLLADMEMPEMTGQEVARQLCAERPRLKVLYMSGYEPHSQAGAGEATVFFKKPFTSSALLEKMREILERKDTAKRSQKRKREKS